MNKNMTTLSQYLDVASTASPLVSAEETRELLQLGDTMPPKRGFRRLASTATILLVVCAGVGLWLYPHSDKRVPQKQMSTLPEGLDSTDTYIEYHFNTPGVRKIFPAYLQRKNINGVRFLHLDSTELLALGVRGLPNGIVQQYEGRKEQMPATMKKSLQKFNDVGISPSETYLCWLTFTPSGQKYQWLPVEEQDVPLRKPLYPRLITDAEGRTRLARFEFHQVTESQLESLERSIDIHSLLPVWVPCGINDSTGDGYVFWYEVTPELISALPEQIGASIRRENDGIEDVRLQTKAAFRKGQRVPVPAAILFEDEPQAEAQQGGESRLTGGDAVYYDIWRSAVGAVVSSLLFPNPVSGRNVVLQYTLDEERSVTITLHDISGRCLAELVPASRKAKGECREALVLPGLQPGMYLVVIQTDRGEYAVQRLVVQ